MLPQNHSLSRLLLDRWYEHLDGGRRKRILWDLGLIQAIIHPEWTVVETITTSRDNGSRSIHYYKDIDAPKMKAKFSQQMREFTELSNKN